MSGVTPVVIDTDPGVDDAIAIWSLLGDVQVDVVGLTTTFGNVPLAQATLNAQRLLRDAGRADIPVHAGMSRPLLSATVHGATQVHGVDGLGGVTLDESMTERAIPTASAEKASTRLIELSRRFDGRLRVIALGPLTNVAMAILRDATFTSRLHSISIMGGAVFRAGNVTPFAEANIWNDPEAAQLVFSAGVPIKLAALDITETQRFSRSDQTLLRAAGDSRLGSLARMLDSYFAFYSDVVGVGDIPLHDPIAALLAAGRVRPTVSRRGNIEIALGGEERGRTLWHDDEDGSVLVPLELDIDARTIIHHLLAALPPEAKGTSE